MLRWLADLFETKLPKNFDERVGDLRGPIADENERVANQATLRAEQETATAVMLARDDVKVWLRTIEKHVAARRYGTSIGVNADYWNDENKKSVPGLDLDRLFKMREQRQLDVYAKELTSLLGSPFTAYSPTEGEYRAIVVSWH